MDPWCRRWRIALTLALVLLTVSGTAWGADDDFPFGPFRMYAATHDLDQPIKDTWAWGTDAGGHQIRLTEAIIGMRRAEVEGQLRRFLDDPERLEILADAYERHRPDAPPLVRIEIRTRMIEMSDGSPTGEESVRVRARWVR